MAHRPEFVKQSRQEESGPYELISKRLRFRISGISKISCSSYCSPLSRPFCFFLSSFFQVFQATGGKSKFEVSVRKRRLRNAFCERREGGGGARLASAWPCFPSLSLSTHTTTPPPRTRWITANSFPSRAEERVAPRLDLFSRRGRRLCVEEEVLRRR